VRGFTLVEVAMASFVLLVGTLAVVGTIDFANRTTVRTKGREAATSLARQVIEDARAIDFQQLDPDGLTADLQRQPGLEDMPGSTGYQVRRRGFTFTINATVCSLDDPRDGIGSHTGGTFCSTGTNWKGCQLLGTVSPTGSANWAAILGALYPSAQTAAAGTSCSTGGPATAADLDPQDYKRVDVTVSWNNHSVRQSTLIANPGTPSGPAVTNLVVTNPSSGATTITNANQTTLGFRATTNRTPAAVNWTLDGDNQGSATGSGTAWDFTWDLGPVDTPKVFDGSYIVGARAVDANGTSGATRTVTMTINRRQPFAPTGLAAGRNNLVVDIEWLPNKERDVLGYRVYRLDGSGATLVCPSSGGGVVTDTACQDLSPPAGTLQYYVVAVDNAPGGSLREGDQSSTVTVPTGNTPPNPPTGLSASSTNGGATTVLVWSAPNPADPDPGDSIAFYRIYRDGTTYGDRYDRTATGSALSYTDANTGGVPHTYYITAVDNHLAESTLVGPVTK
jgi:hypothetical protein